MQLTFVDSAAIREPLYPLTFTKPAADLRLGLQTGRQRWERALDVSESDTETVHFLTSLFPLKASNEMRLRVASNLLPSQELVNAIKGISEGEILVDGNGQFLASLIANPELGVTTKTFLGETWVLKRPQDLFLTAGRAIIEDFEASSQGKTSAPLHETVTVIGPKNRVFLEDGAKAVACILNVEAGPIYLEKGAEIMEGSVVRGPLALGEGSQLKLSAKVYGPTSIGPHCKVGGEVSNSVMLGYSNKGHDGFLGNSVIGEWCNLGADTNTSNLKNNYAEVKQYNYATRSMEATGLQFCGLVMGDHAKSGINTMFNTGTVVGFGANVFGAGFPPTYIPNFAWGGAESMEAFRVDKAIELAERVYSRRGKNFSEEEATLFRYLSENEGFILW